MLLGVTSAISGLVQGVATVAGAGFVAFAWRRNMPLPIRAASLVSATLVSVPLALFYDLVLAGLAAAWLLRAEGKYALGEGGRLALAGLYILCLNPRGLAVAWHLPVGPFVAVALAALVATVAFRGASAKASFAIGGQAPRQPSCCALLDKLGPVKPPYAALDTRKTTHLR
jgi:hypothetical protein